MNRTTVVGPQERSQFGPPTRQPSSFRWNCARLAGFPDRIREHHLRADISAPDVEFCCQLRGFRRHGIRKIIFFAEVFAQIVKLPVTVFIEFDQFEIAIHDRCIKFVDSDVRSVSVEPSTAQTPGSGGDRCPPLPPLRWAAAFEQETAA